MLKFNKAYEIRELMRRSVKRSELISSLFEDCPDLQQIVFDYTSEYDDNNYSSYARLRSVNGHRIDYDDNYEEEDSGSELPKVSKEVVRAADELVGLVADEFGHGEDIELNREDYPPNYKGPMTGDLTEAESEYLSSYLCKGQLPVKWFMKKDAKWASYYALDHGRFDEETEFKIFAKKGRMRDAYWYAFGVIKGRLPEPIENFFILSSESKDTEDHEWLRRYMEFRTGIQKVVGVSVEPSLCVLGESSGDGDKDSPGAPE